MFPKHPEIYKFVDCLKLFEFEKRSEMIELRDIVCEKQLQRKRKKDKVRGEKIEFFSSLLKKNEISIREFLEAMGNRVILPSSGRHFPNLQVLYFISDLSLLLLYIAFQVVTITSIKDDATDSCTDYDTDYDTDDENDDDNDDDEE